MILYFFIQYTCLTKKHYVSFFKYPKFHLYEFSIRKELNKMTNFLSRKYDYNNNISSIQINILDFF